MNDEALKKLLDSAKVDQARASMAQMGGLLFTFRAELITTGTPEHEAAQLVSQYFQWLLSIIQLTQFPQKPL
jgi:hypothetical protein